VAVVDFSIPLGEFLKEYGEAITALFTVVLSISTIGLWLQTKRLARDSDAQTLNMKKSIDLARAEFLSTHRPRIILREAIIGSVLEDEPIHVVYQLANIGETQGTIINSGMRVEVVNRTVERLLMHPNVEDSSDLGEIKLGPGESRLLRIDGPDWQETTFTPQLRDDGEDGALRWSTNCAIHFVGQILYEDEVGIRRRTGFRRELVVKRQRFYQIEGEPDLDYDD
jgi:hypothetical protein